MSDHHLRAQDVTLAIVLGRLASIMDLMNETRASLQELEAPETVIAEFDKAGEYVAVVTESISHVITKRIWAWAEGEGVVEVPDIGRMN